MAVRFEVAEFCIGVDVGVFVGLSEDLGLVALALKGKIGDLFSLHTHWTLLQQVSLVYLILEGDRGLSESHQVANLFSVNRREFYLRDLFGFFGLHLDLAVLDELHQLFSHLFLHLLLQIDANSNANLIDTLLLVPLYFSFELVAFLPQPVYLSHQQIKYLLELGPTPALAVQSLQNLRNILLLVANQLHYLELLIVLRWLPCGWSREVAELESPGDACGFAGFEGDEFVQGELGAH